MGNLPIPRHWLHGLLLGFWMLLGQLPALIAETAIPDSIAGYMQPAKVILTEHLSAKGIDPPQYIGTATCLECHANRLQDQEQTHPAFLEYGIDGDWQGHACETCHGPGSMHTVGAGNAEGILHPLKLTAGESNGICMSCHAGTHWGTAQGWFASAHAQADVACVTCHDPHRETPMLLRPLDAGIAIGEPTEAQAHQPALVLGPPFSGPQSALTDWEFSSVARELANEERFCTSCHSDVALDFKLRSHHPIEHPGFSCTSCHDPHTPDLKGADLIRKTNGLCESCHSDYAGPFVFNHAPVHDVSLGDGCITCHQPHGSPHNQLLTIDNRALCLQCHVDQDSVGPEAHFAGTCWTAGCHSQVHGSQHQIYFIEDDLGGLAVLH